MATEQKKNEFAETHLGTFGAFLPLLTLIALIITLSAMKMRSSQNFYAAAFVAISVGFITFKDKDRYMGALLKGLRSPMFTTMVLIFFVSAIFSKILIASNVTQSLLMLVQIMHVPAGVLPLACFIIGCMISFATGSASAALSTLIPVMLPLGVSMGINPGLMCGVIASSAVFGDNLAPISDSTIASTQGVGCTDISKAVRHKVKYSAVAFVPSAILFLIFGLRMASSGNVATVAEGASLANLAFMILPVLIFVLILKKVNFIVSLLSGIFAGVVLLFLFGLGSFELIFGTTGVIVTGFTSMFNTVAFMMMIFMVLSLTQEAGGLQKISTVMTKISKSETAAEAACGGFMCITCAVVASGLSSMGFCGPLVSEILEPFHISKERVSSMLAGFGVALVQMLPYSPPVIGTIATCAATGAVDPNTFTPFSYLPFNFYAIALILVYWVAILTGIGRTHDTPAN